MRTCNQMWSDNKQKATALQLFPKKDQQAAAVEAAAVHQTVAEVVVAVAAVAFRRPQTDWASGR